MRCWHMLLGTMRSATEFGDSRVNNFTSGCRASLVGLGTQLYLGLESYYRTVVKWIPFHPSDLSSSPLMDIQLVWCSAFQGEVPQFHSTISLSVQWMDAGICRNSKVKHLHMYHYCDMAVLVRRPLGFQKSRICGNEDKVLLLLQLIHSVRDQEAYLRPAGNCLLKCNKTLLGLQRTWTCRNDDKVLLLLLKPRNISQACGQF